MTKEEYRRRKHHILELEWLKAMGWNEDEVEFK